MDTMPDQHSMRHDHRDRRRPLGTGSDPGDLSVVFSASPAPETADHASTDAPVPTGWPWFLPQDGLRREDLEHTVDIDEDPTAAAVAMARIPLVRGATVLLEHVGAGLPLTGEGEIPAADVRAIAEDLGLDLGGQEPGAMREIGEIVGSWNALLAGGWLDVQGAEVVPGEGMVPAAAQDEDPAAFVRFARALLVLLVLEGLRQAPEEGGLFGGPDTFTALLHTVAPDGLLLPAAVRVALDRGLVPADPAGDPDMDEINRYWQVEHDLSTLAAYGLLRRESAEGGQDLRFRGTAEVLLEAYGALEMHQELG
jgi:hypothetical protein